MCIRDSLYPTLEMADNALSRYIAQKGKCAVTHNALSISDMVCVHIKPCKGDVYKRQEQLCSYKGSLETEMSALLQKRKELYSKSRRTSGEEKEAVKAELSDISGRLKVIRKEVRLCEGISARSDTLKEKLQTIRADEHEQQRKELMKNEHRRRSGRTNRPNELGGL